MKIIEKERHGEGLEYSIAIEDSSEKGVYNAYLKLATIGKLNSFKVTMEHDFDNLDIASHVWRNVDDIKKEAMSYLNNDTCQIEMITEIDDNYVVVFSVGNFNTDEYDLRVWNCLDKGCVEKFIKEASKLI